MTTAMTEIMLYFVGMSWSSSYGS